MFKLKLVYFASIVNSREISVCGRAYMHTVRSKVVHVDTLKFDNSQHVRVLYVLNWTLGYGTEDCGFESWLGVTATIKLSLSTQ